jgi:hypothetical protein
LDDFDEDDEIESLKDRLNAYRLDSSPEQSAGKFSPHQFISHYTSLAFNKIVLMKLQLFYRN